MQYFGDLREVKQPWLFAVIFVVEAVFVFTVQYFECMFAVILVAIDCGIYIRKPKTIILIVSVIRIDFVWFYCNRIRITKLSQYYTQIPTDSPFRRHTIH